MGEIRILKASAGSGKTYTLAYEYIKKVIARPDAYKNILAVTFTNKATEEMKQRIIKELHILSSAQNSNYQSALEKELGMTPREIEINAQKAQSHILHDYSRFSVLTIDKFFQRVIRSFIKELGMDLNFNIELKTQGILENASDTLIEKISSDQALRDWIVAYIDEKIEQGSKWSIKEQLMELGEEIFKDSFHQSELSREQIHKIINTLAHEVNKAKNSLVETAKKITSLAQENQLSEQDFSFKESGAYGYVVKLTKGIIEEPSKRATNIASGENKWYSGKTPNPKLTPSLQQELTNYLIDICNTYEQNIERFNTYKLLKQNYRNFALLGELSNQISELYAEQNILHITETNRMLKDLIAGNDTPFIFEKVGNVFSTFMIDEFQDTSQNQWQNFIPLLENALSSSEPNEQSVLLVGDIKQSIYRWRGGDWRILGHDAREIFPLAKERNLEVNYRSMRNVVDFNNAMIEAITNNVNQNLNLTLSKELEASHKNMLEDAYRSHYQQPKSETKEGYVNISLFDKKDNSLIINKIETLQAQGYYPGEIAILVEKNSEAKQLASMLLQYKSEHRDSKYCYDVVTAEALEIGRSFDVNFIISLLKLSSKPNQAIPSSLVNKYLGRELNSNLDSSTSELINTIKTLSPLEAFEMIINHYSLGNNNEELAYLQALHNQIINYCSSNIADTMQFVRWWEKSGAEQSINIPQSLSAITIITVHKSKGLQFKCVIIPYCNWSLMPKTGSTIWAEAEENNLKQLNKMPIDWTNDMEKSYFKQDYIKETILSHIDRINGYYVASTRAQEELHIMIPTPVSKNRISTQINQVLENNSFIEGLGGVRDDSGTSYSFGSPVIKKKETYAEPLTFDTYPTRDISAKANLRQRTSRYYDQDEKPANFSPRDYGILMHRLFENASSLEGVLSAGERLLSDSVINSQELTLLKDMVTTAMSNPTIKSWFSSEWTQIRNENQIILPNNQHIKRPDRVMIKDNKAVVVDYKFGLNRSNSHHRQVSQYAQILTKMGYQNVEGYLWYVSLEDVEKVV